MERWIYFCNICKVEHEVGCDKCSSKNLKGKKGIRASGDILYFLQCMDCQHENYSFQGRSGTCSSCGVFSKIPLNSTTKHQFVIKGSDRYVKASKKPKWKSSNEEIRRDNNPEKWYYSCVGCNHKVKVTCSNCERNLFINKGSSLMCVNCKRIASSFEHFCPSFSLIPPWDEVKLATNDFNANRDKFSTADNNKGRPIILIALIIFILWIFFTPDIPFI